MNQFLKRLTSKMEFEGGRSVKGYKHRLLLMMDEFTSLGKLEIFDKALAYMAGYGLKAFIIVQDINQLNKAYGKDNAIMANCHVRIAYAPNTVETAKVLSDMAGKTTIVQKKTSVSGKGIAGKSLSTSLSETSRPLLTPDEVMALPGLRTNARGKFLSAGDMLIFVAGNPPIYGRQVPYFIDPVLMERAKMPPPQKTSPAKPDEEAGEPQSQGRFPLIPYEEVFANISNPKKGKDDDNPGTGN